MYLRKRPAKNTIFTNSLLGKTSGNATESCNFTKNELLHRFFSRALIVNFRKPIFKNTSQVAASAEAYSGLCQIFKIEFFCEYN